MDEETQPHIYLTQYNGSINNITKDKGCTDLYDDDPFCVVNI